MGFAQYDRSEALARLQDRADLLRLRNLKTPANPVRAFTVTPIPNSFGATIQFTVGPDLTGCAQINILRNGINDLSSATLLNSYPLTAENANGSFQYIDSDQVLLTDQFYWLQTIPLPERAGLAQTEISTRIVSGPVSLSALSANLLPPDAIADWSASLGAGSIVQLICVNFQRPQDPNFGSCQIQATGYLGDSNAVVVAQNSSSPFSFSMQKTGETVTLKAFAISQNGIAATSATSITLTLNGSETVPAKLENVAVTVITTGVQVDFDAGLESDITSYKVYRGPHGSGFGAATLKTTITSTGSRHYTYLDTTGISDVTAGSYFDYFVTAVNPAGASAASAAAAAIPPLQNMDQIGDGSTYARTKGAYLQSGVPYNNRGTWSSITAYVKGDEVQSGGNYWLCLIGNTNSTPAVGNANWQLLGPTSLDNLGDGSTYARPLAVRISGGKPLIDFSESIHLNKILDNIGDGSTYARVKSTALTTGNIDFSKTGFANKTLDFVSDGATYGSIPLANIAGTGTSKRALIDFTQSHANKNLDNVSDGSTYKRVANVNADNTFHVSTSLNQQASILPGQAILMTYQIPSSSVIVGTWNQQSLTRPDASTLTLTASAGPTLISNGNMESGTLGSAEPSWNISFNGPLVTANDNVHGGSFSGKQAGGTNTLNGQAINVTGGQVYVVEGWIKCDAMPTSSGHGAWFQVALNGGVTAFTKVATFMPTDGSDTSTSTAIEIGYAANGAAHGWGFFQCYFIPNANGQVIFYCQNISISGNAWFDDCNFYVHNGICYTGLTASQSYYIYPYIGVSGNTGTMGFTNGNPPSTSPSDVLALQCGYDGRIAVGVAKITMPASGSGGGSVSGGGSGSCPEYYQPVFVRRYDDTGNLVLDGQMYAGDVQLGFDPDENHAFPRGDFLKGYSFTQQQDVYRAVTFTQIVPCGGWMIVNGYKVTACETVYVNGAWTPAWKAVGAAHDSVPGMKVQIQVKADADDEHNYYVGTLLIHNYIPAS